jgi:aminoglycoside phosphotransferase (APT) family kinase protein
MPAHRPDQIAATVSAFAPAGVRAVPEWRWWRWVVHLGDDVALVADDGDGWARLEREAALLERLQRGGRLGVPRVIVRDQAAGVQLRRKVPGLNGFAIEELVFGRPGKLTGPERYAGELVITPQGERLAADLGRAILEVQRAMGADEARALGFPDTPYLSVLDQVSEHLGRRPALARLAEALPELRRWFAALPADPVVALRDLQMHNVAVDSATGALLGLFDFDDAGVAHRLEDFKYLPSFGRRFTDLALSAYRDAGGPSLDVADVWRFHALSALEHFLFVPEGTERWREIVAWSAESLHLIR